jgi:hypothetical protein
LREKILVDLLAWSSGKKTAGLSGVEMVAHSVLMMESAMAGPLDGY